MTARIIAWTKPAYAAEGKALLADLLDDLRWEGVGDPVIDPAFERARFEAGGDRYQAARQFLEQLDERETPAFAERAWESVRITVRTAVESIKVGELNRYRRHPEDGGR